MINLPLAPQTLADMVAVRRRFARSVHLERDWHSHLTGPTDQDASVGYHLTPCAYELLKIVDGARARPADRALTVVGPYGAGKSAFCVFLAGLVSGGAAEQRVLSERDPALAQSLGDPSKRLIPVPVVGSRAPLAAALVSGLRDALQTQAPDVARTLKGAVSDNPTPREVADLYERAAQLATKHGWGGLLLLVDELGKFLEYAALHPKDGDIFTLQELAEAAARSRAPLAVVAVLHQNADAYAQKLGRAHQAEWAKVGERFREVPFFPSDAERMDMVGYALQHAPELHLNGNFSSLTAQGAQRLPATIAARFDEMARAAYPLHPTVTLALPALFRKTGQSHRSLFNFLAGEEAHALGRFIRESLYTPDAPPLFMLDRLFDYAAEVLLGGWSAGTLARLWAEATAAVERAQSVSPDARRVLKCVALLGLLRDPQLPASRPVLEWALTGTDGAAPNVEAALSELTGRQLIAWSRTRELYRLWEGGDVDIEAALETARSGLGAGISLRAATDRDLCPLPRLIARRHSFETGTLRAVETRPCGVGELAAITGNDDLMMVLCLAENAGEAERALAIARKSGGANALVVIARETEILREAGRDVAAAGEVAANTPALQSDRAARRELAARRFEAESAFRGEWERCFGPSARESVWLYNGETVRFETGRELSAFLSRMADAVYEATPVLRNELINRRALSSAAAAGRRALIEAMLLHPGEPRLGIEGFPPEFSMYECLLRVTRLHRETAPGVWEFGAPPSDDPARLREVWQLLDAEIFAQPPAPRPVSELWDKLAAPPYGLSEGVMPPLLLAWMLSHAHETTLYREGTYLAEPGVPDWEILLRRPEHFAVAGSRIEGERAQIVERLAAGLGVQPFAVPVAQALIRNMRRLPEYARRTARLPAQTKALRRALEGVASPEKLLFADLPQALGVSGLFGEGAEIDIEAFFVTLNGALQAWNTATPTMIAQARDALLEACGLPTGVEGWTSLRRECGALEGRVADARLVPFINRAAAPGDDASLTEGVLALLANRPPRSWSDGDQDRFALQARDIGQLFRAARDQEANATVVVTIAHSSFAPAPLQNTATQPQKQLPQVLATDEARQSRELADLVLAQLGETLKAAPPQVRRAALEIVMSEMSEER